MKQILGIITITLIATSLGLAAGFYIKSNQNLHTPEENHESHEEHATNSIVISPEVRKNLDIVTAPLKLQDFTSYTSVLGHIEAPSVAEQPIFAPVSGIIADIYVEPGMKVKAGDPLAKLIRDPLPRVELTLTSEILKPAIEEFHASLGEFRRSVKNIEILKKEYQRLENYANQGDSGFPIVPKKRLIEIRYELDKAENEQAIILRELEHHGLSKDQMYKSLNQFPRVDAQIWHKALENHGLWPKIAEKIHKSLPPHVQALHWTMATIGELVAAGLLNEDLFQWMQSNPEVKNNFLEIGGLLQRGNTLEIIRYLHQAKSFQATIEISAPDSMKDWNIAKIYSKPGQKVTEGTALLQLSNFSQMYLVAVPIGAEEIIVYQALQKKLVVEATPLLSQSAPNLAGIQFHRMEREDGKLHFYAKVPNSVIDIPQKNKTFRSWILQNQQRYKVKIPQNVLSQVYVIPNEGLSEDGSNFLVFIENGSRFEAVNVHVLYKDHEVAVISSASNVFPGDSVVIKGAFSLYLALKSQTDSGSDSHGHAH